MPHSDIQYSPVYASWLSLLCKVVTTVQVPRTIFGLATLPSTNCIVHISVVPLVYIYCTSVHTIFGEVGVSSL